MGPHEHNKSRFPRSPQKYNACCIQGSKKPRTAGGCWDTPSSVFGVIDCQRMKIKLESQLECFPDTDRKKLPESQLDSLEVRERSSGFLRTAFLDATLSSNRNENVK